MHLTVIDRRAEMPNYSRYKDTRRVSAVTGIAVHHSGTADWHTGSPTGTARVIFHYHVHALGWEHGGYHYIITPRGHIEYALDEQIPAYHAGFDDPDDLEHLESGQYWNHHYLAICVAGWFDQDRRVVDTYGKSSIIPNRFTKPSRAQQRALIALIQHLRHKYGIPITHVQGHRELKGSNTTCPGLNLDLDQLRAQLATIERGPIRQQRVHLHLKSFMWRKRLNETVMKIARRADQYLPPLWRAGKWLLLPGLLLAQWRRPPYVQFLLRLVMLAVLLSGIPVLLLRWYTPRQSIFMRQVSRHLSRSNPGATLLCTWTPLRQIPLFLSHAIIAAEDPTFFHHPGFCLYSMYVAWLRNFTGAARTGGSTITQQLAKNLFLWPGRTYLRKLFELYFTVWLELWLSKPRLLELYLNIVQMDGHVFGMGAAAQHWFHKPLAELSEDEMIQLVSAVANPHFFRIDAQSDFMLFRQQQIRQLMAAVNITQLQAYYDGSS